MTAALRERLAAMTPEEREEWARRNADALRPLFEKLTEAFRSLWPAIDRLHRYLLPLLAEARRQEARRVHTAYRRRKRGRW